MSERQAERREQWRQMIAEQEKSGESIRVYCQGRDVSEYAFYSWRQRFRKEIPVTFALVETKPTSEAVVIASVSRWPLRCGAKSKRRLAINVGCPYVDN